MIARSLFALLCLCSAVFATGAQATDYKVSGVSYPDYFNGTYIETGENSGKPYYRKDTPESWSGEVLIFFDGYSWNIGPDLMMREIYNDSQANTPPEQGWQSMMGSGDTIRVTVAGPGISYASKLFIESLANDGSFTQTVAITHNNTDGQTFNGVFGEDLVQSGRVSLSNVPAGLNAKVIYQSATELTLSFEGNAQSASMADSISNVGVTFFDTAFLGGGNTSADNTSGAVTSDIVLQFRDALSVGASGDYATIKAAIAAAQPYQILQIEQGEHTEKGIDVDKNLAIVGAGAGKTIIQAAATADTAGDRIFRVDSGLTDVIFSDVTIRHGQVYGSQGATGGGIDAYSPIVLQNCEVSNNHLSARGNNALGGAIYAQKSITVDNCLFEGNHVAMAASRLFGGGAIAIRDGGVITNSTFKDNKATYTGDLSIREDMAGGAIVVNSSTPFTLVNSTFVNNEAPGKGGGIGFTSSKNTQHEIVNNIFWQNVSTSFEAEASIGVIGGSATINIRNTIAEHISSSGDSTVNKINVIEADPLFDTFGNYGGNTALFALTAGSPAIGAGVVTSDVPDLDQRGYSRSNNPDIGAYQFDATQPYYVTYHANGGTGDVPELGYSLSDGKSFTASDAGDLSRTDYTFSGWNTLADGTGTAYAAQDSVTISGSDVDLYAQWLPDSVYYSLNYAASTGGSISGNASQTVEEGTDGSAVTAVADTGYSFVDWSDGVTTAERQDLSVAADVSVTANFAQNEYTVTFVVNGTEFGQQQVLHGNAASAPGSPTVTGYSFTGWDIDFSEVTGDLTVTAQFAINSYQVRFYDHLNNLLTTQSVDYGSDANTVAPAAPERVGYTFSGWSSDISSITAALDVTAQYSINSYTVTFADYDGTVLDTQPVEYQAAATAPTQPTRTGYTFDGWDSSFGSITGDTTITAQYVINSYAVTFADHDGTVLDTQSVEYQAAATAPAQPTRTGYTFDGWDSSFGSITGDITITAQYSINSYSVTFADHDGTVLDTQSVEYQSAATAPAQPTRTGYTFTGWEGDFSSIIGDITITAQYSINSYSVTFADHDGTVLDTQSVEYQSAATAPAQPTRTGYTFTGWEGDFSSISGDITITAQYSINSYSVTFADHDGTVLDTQSVDYQAAATAPAEPTRTGYSFTGWDAGFSSITGDTTVTAQYSINSYSVTFADHDGTVLDTQSVEYQSAATAPAQPTRTGYTFDGWDSSFGSITGDTTITAQYVINSYTVTFADHDGSVLDTQSVEYQSAATAPAEPTRTGYSFTGWEGDFSSITGDITITAQYSINSYTVTFADHDGTVLDTQSVEYQSAATAPEVPTREGHTFTGWDVAFDSITADLTVTAEYELSQFKVSFWIVGEGTVSPEEPLVAWGEQKTFSINAARGYRLADVSGCGVSHLKNNQYQTDVITADCELVVKFFQHNVNDGVIRSFLFWTIFAEQQD